MFTIPTIVTSNDLKKRSYVTFYFNNQRIREYNGNNLNIKLKPNLATSISARDELLQRLQFELRKALEVGAYPSINKPLTIEPIKAEEPIVITAKSLLAEALSDKLNSQLSKTYKRDLKTIHDQFVSFMQPSELEASIESITKMRTEKFLSQFGSSGTYYMNKRRNLGVLFSAASRLIDKPLKSVKDTSRRKSKAKLHEKYEQSQLKPILNYLKAHYPNLYICCLLTYSSWLRPHEEIRLLTLDNFKNNMTEVHLGGDENKGMKVRVVYIPDYVRAELSPVLSKLNRKDNIFSLAPVPFNESYFNTQWSRAYAKMFVLGLVYEDQTIYSFRHTAAVKTYRRTKDVFLLQKLLGHSTIVVTLKYLRGLGELNTDELKEAAPQLD
ncbi:Integrase [Mucilaginibacter lappiensis]|nr:Integrase [Mucilaginibacter lappiensis]